MVSQNTLFPVIPFHHLSDCDQTEAGEDENDQPGQNQELVPKRGTTYVAWSRFEQLNKHTYLRQNPRLCKYPQTQRFRS